MQNSDFHVTSDKSHIDFALTHQFLSEHSTWAKNIPASILRTAIEQSLCFVGILNGKQIAFARVITDQATFANLVDVFVLPEHRGHAYSKLLMQAILCHPNLQGLRRFTLATSDAHGLYAQFGFAAPLKPDSYMELYRPNVYSQA